MQENENTTSPAEPELHDERERQNRPHWKRFKLQGENRFLVKIHKQIEQRNKYGLITELDNDNLQNEACTGTVIALSPMTEEAQRNYPDVKVGCNIQVVPLTWTWFYCLGERLATGTLDYIIAVYDWKSQKTLEEEAAEQEAEHRAVLAKYQAEKCEALSKIESVATGVGIIVK